MAGSGPHQTSPSHAESCDGLTFISKASSITLDTEIMWTTSGRAAHRRSMPVEVVINEGVIWCKSKLMKRICNEKLMI